MHGTIEKLEAILLIEETMEHLHLEMTRLDQHLLVFDTLPEPMYIECSCFSRFSVNSYHLWTRWGRVGEAGSNSLGPAGDLDAVMMQFEKKFSDKTKNKWANRDKFKPVPGKYTLLEMDDDSEGDEEEVRGGHQFRSSCRGYGDDALPHVRHFLFTQY